MFIAALFITAKLEATTISFWMSFLAEWINKLTYPDNRILFTIKTKGLSSHKKRKDVDKHSMHVTKWKKSVWKGYILFDSNYDILEKAKIMETVRGSAVARGWGKEGWLGRAERIARAVKLLRVILQWCMHVTEHRISPVSPNINYGGSDVSVLAHWL